MQRGLLFVTTLPAERLLLLLLLVCGWWWPAVLGLCRFSSPDAAASCVSHSHTSGAAAQCSAVQCSYSPEQYVTVQVIDSTATVTVHYSAVQTSKATQHSISIIQHNKTSPHPHPSNHLLQPHLTSPHLIHSHSHPTPQQNRAEQNTRLVPDLQCSAAVHVFSARWDACHKPLKSSGSLVRLGWIFFFYRGRKKKKRRRKKKE